MRVYLQCIYGFDYTERKRKGFHSSKPDTRKPLSTRIQPLTWKWPRKCVLGSLVLNEGNISLCTVSEFTKLCASKFTIHFCARIPIEFILNETARYLLGFEEKKCPEKDAYHHQWNGHWDGKSYLLQIRPMSTTNAFAQDQSESSIERVKSKVADLCKLHVGQRPNKRKIEILGDCINVHFKQRVGIKEAVHRQMEEYQLEVDDTKIRMEMIRAQRYSDGSTTWFLMINLLKTVDEQDILNHIRTHCDHIMASPPRSILLYHHRYREDYLGYAFVECAEDAQITTKCMRKLDWTTLKGMQIRCRLSGDVSEMGWDRNVQHFGKTRFVSLFNVQWNVERAEVQAMCGAYGRVVRAREYLTTEYGYPTGHFVVEMETPKGAAAVFEALHDMVVRGVRITTAFGHVPGDVGETMVMSKVQNIRRYAGQSWVNSKVSIKYKIGRKWRGRFLGGDGEVKRSLERKAVRTLDQIADKVRMNEKYRNRKVHASRKRGRFRATMKKIEMRKMKQRFTGPRQYKWPKGYKRRKW